MSKPGADQLDLLLTVRLNLGDRIPWECRLRKAYKLFARLGVRILDHQPLAPLPADPRDASKPPAAAAGQGGTGKATSADGAGGSDR